MTWGAPDSGGNSEKVQHQLTKVTAIQANYGAFAAIREDGRVVCWGDQCKISPKVSWQSLDPTSRTALVSSVCPFRPVYARSFPRDAFLCRICHLQRVLLLSLTPCVSLLAPTPCSYGISIGSKVMTDVGHPMRPRYVPYS